MAPRYDQDSDPANPDYQPQPLCGASIGAYKDEEHLPPVSFGGIVNIDGRSYGMSVHHMLENDDSDPEPEDDKEDDVSDTSSLLSMSSRPSSPLSSEDNSTVRQLSAPSSLSLDETLQTTGDSASILPGSTEADEISITQPALDDAISLNLHADEANDSDSDSGSDSCIAEDHILSYKLGQLHASSGLKRTATHSTETGYRGIGASLPQEIDWALFELLPPRAHPFNIVRGGRAFCDSQEGGKDTLPTTIKPALSLANARVHCLGRTSGLASGTISSTMELLKLHGRSTFAASWAVHGGFGVGGDSGAWVVSSEGEVCGHVLAERGGRTYICAMEVLFEDIRETLGVGVVGLPVGREGEGKPAGKEGMEESVEEAVARMKLDDKEAGGVALPVSPRKKRELRGAVQHCEREKGGFEYGVVEPLSSAG